ncbi:alpha-ribazole phosphatase [Rapidithrix thailandica]|uniref:Alpha-ribazole phosphatase n=1 Tax=Rapidithrix thailandica TaxID=413964 RepID=A0AAW9S8M1_9BACT
MEIYLIRHTTPDIPKGTVYGRLDIPLVNTFEIEVKDILQKLPDALDAVYTSPSQRCKHLADKLYSRKNIIDPRLMEYNFGEWEGLKWENIEETQLQIWMDDFVNQSPPGGENMSEMQQRVLSVWQEILQTKQEQIALVTHGGVIRLLLAHLENVPLERSFERKLNYGALFHIQIQQHSTLQKNEPGNSIRFSQL